MMWEGPAMRRPSVLALIGIVGAIWGLASEAVYYQNGAPALDVLRDLAIGWTYLYGGLAIWSSRPANPTGRLMTLVGFTWFIGNLQLSGISPLHEIGTAFADVVFVCLIALVLAYPRGSLETRLDRWTVVILAIGTTVNDAVRLVPAAAGAELETARLYVGLALAIFAYAVVIRRWVVAPKRRRPELVPVLIAGVVMMGVLATSLAIQAFDVSEDVQAFLLAARGLAPAAIPLALLVGFYRQSELRQRSLLEAIPDVMIRFGPDGHYHDLSADDPGLISSPPRPAAGGRVSDLLPQDVAETLTRAASVTIETGRMQSVDFAIGLPSGRREYEARLSPSGADEVTAVIRDFTSQRAAEAEQRAAQLEVRRSRARIIEATDAERRRLERDLHDGAQQRLVATSLALRLARMKLSAGDDEAAVGSLESASEELRLALDELRELARGIHPAILTEAGLGPAIESLAARSTVPSTVSGLPDRRLSPAVESTAYFVVSEALTNVAKYSSATEVTISAECPSDSLRVEVSDDGVGGADPAAGSGLRGLADRVAALGGQLSVVSPSGGGTRVRAEIPLTD
jgi:signal transduction histidine kinase